MGVTIGYMKLCTIQYDLINKKDTDCNIRNAAPLERTDGITYLADVFF